MQKRGGRPSGACYVRVSSLVELGRLACALERAPFPLFSFKSETSYRIAAQADLFMGVPIFYYIDLDKTSEFLAYRNIGEIEEAQLVDSASSPSYIYSPIIKVSKMPRELERKNSFNELFMSIKVEDLQSLMKVGTYKMLFDEPPLPLFAFESNGKWIIGAFTRIDEYEEASMFFYTELHDEPVSGFIRYTPSNIQSTSFSKRIDEHGFVYVKVIKLAEKHPLVRL